MSPSHKPTWQLPAGVSRATWDYLQAEHIATDYDRYFHDSALMKLDMQVLNKYLPPAASDPKTVVADLGCGTGRVAEQLLPRGYQMLNVDLSDAMLREVETKIPAEFRESSQNIKANLVDIDQHLQAASVDMAVCLFSSLGMIRGSKHRRKFLSGVRQILKPAGTVFLHVHNRFHSLLDPGGPKWLLRSWLASCLDSSAEFGDRTYSYRQLPQMFLHIYSRRELMADLRAAHFSPIEILPIASAGDRLLSKRERPSMLRAGGFFAVAVSASSSGSM